MRIVLKPDVEPHSATTVNLGTFSLRKDDEEFRPKAEWIEPCVYCGARYNGKDNWWTLSGSASDTHIYVTQIYWGECRKK